MNQGKARYRALKFAHATWDDVARMELNHHTGRTWQDGEAVYRVHHTDGTSTYVRVELDTATVAAHTF